MNTFLIVIGISILVVAFFAVGMSLTLMIKGHHIDSEIATNKNMQKLGIKCVLQDTGHHNHGDADCNTSCGSDCGSCTTHILEERK